MPIAVAAHVAIAIPIFVEPVHLGAHLYGDGGIVDIFQVQPLLEAGPDRMLGLNCYLPERLEGADVTGWRWRGFMNAGREAAQAYLSGLSTLRGPELPAANVSPVGL